MELSLACSVLAGWLGRKPLGRLGRGTLVLILLCASILAPSHKLSAQTPPTPKQLKLNAITALEHISTTDRKLERTVKTAIRAITRSLSDRGRSLFLDGFRIFPPPKGEKVFREDRRAVERLLKAIKRKHTAKENKGTFQDVIDSLVEADRRITEHSIAAAQRLVQVGEGNPRKVAKAQREFERAVGKSNPVKGIRNFMKAWETSQEVVKENGLVIKSFTDSPDPLFAGVATNTLSVIFQAGKTDKVDYEKKKAEHVLELVQIIQDSTGAVVRRLISREEFSGFRRSKRRSNEISMSSTWNGRDEEGKVVPSGIYSYIAFGRIVKAGSDLEKHSHRSNRRWHRFRESWSRKEKDKRKAEAISFPVVGAISVIQLGVTITSPVAGRVIDTSSVLVQGFIDALPGTEVGVTVNGVVAEVNNGVFAGLIGLELGNNIITAVAVDSMGDSATDSLSIDVLDPREEPLRLLASPATGLAPLVIELRPSSLLDRPIALFEYDFDGDGVVDVSSTIPDAVSYTYSQEGLFFPTLTITDDLGNQISATTIVNVFPLPDLVAKWDSMKDALKLGDVDGALSFIAEESRARYQEIFAVISSQLFQIESILSDLQLVAVRSNEAEFAMLRNGTDGIERSFYVLFVRDNDGIWRLRTF